MRETKREAKIWVYCGEGIGIAGLPHEITMEQAERDGLAAALQDAIDAGQYKVKEA